MARPISLTTLHIVAPMQGAEDVMDALTNNPYQVPLQISLKLDLSLV